MKAIALIAALSTTFAVAFWLTPSFARLDDAYIALHSARVVLSGHDPIYQVPALVGVTSPAYVALLTAIIGAGVRAGSSALRLANALGFVAYVSALLYLGQTVGLTPIRKAALIAIALASGFTLFHLTNGLETGWAMAVLTFAIGCAYAERLVLVSICAGLLPFLRPDLAPAALLVLCAAAWGRPWRQQLSALGLALVVAAPWLLWMRVDTGSWLTQTIRAKQLFYAEGCLPWLKKTAVVAASFAACLGLLFPLSLGIASLGRSRLGRVGLLSIAICLLSYFVAYPGALGLGFFRYLYPIVVPWLCFGFALGLTRVNTGVAATVAIALLVTRLVIWPDRHTDEYAREVVASAEWIDDHVPPDAVLLVHDAGGISEFAHRRAVDLVGLKTPASIQAHARWTYPSCGRARRVAVDAIARESGASYFVGLSGWEEPLRADLEANGFTLTARRRPPVGVRAGYTVYQLAVRP